MGVLDTLDAATPSRHTVSLILDAALHAEVQAIEAAFQAAIDDDKRDGSMADPTPHYNAAIRRREAIVERIKASKVTFTFERIPPWKKVALQAAHPPRPGNLVDASRGFNFETYLPALVRGSVIAVTGADGDTKTGDDIPDALWDKLLGTAGSPAYDATDTEPARPEVKGTDGTLNSQQLQDLIDGATQVNDGSPVVPRSALSLLVSQDSGESSTPPAPGPAPRPAAGTGGSPSAPPKSSGGPKKTSKKAPAEKASSGRSAAS